VTPPITEARNPRTTDIDCQPVEGILRLINAEDHTVAAAVEAAIPQLVPVVEKTAETLHQGGYLFYFGAGTSGRLAVLDAAECWPTYRCQQVVGMIAGGDAALRHPVEGAEDNAQAGVDDFNAALAAHPAPVPPVVVGISASGNAPYVVAAVTAARQAECFTAGVVCDPQSKLAAAVEQPVVTAVGPEVVAGSTRMKAGTAQKLVLNMVSTATMIRIGKTYENWMVDVTPTNQKLHLRARRMVSSLTGVSETEAASALAAAGGEVKTAVVMLTLGVGYAEAHQCLQRFSGRLRDTLLFYSSGEPPQ
jgi:N-acetylmuramic acid 6-phosphate etherase